METLLDISTLSVEEVIGKLLASEDPSDLALAMSDDKLYLSEERWLQRYKLEGDGGRIRG
jgi:hypothetical protein